MLIANIVLAARSGTEVVTMELAQGLARRGHQVAVFAPFTGPSASTLSTQGIAVTHELDGLPWKPDIIHGHHNMALVPVLAKYPDVPALFVMHDASQDLSRPPSTPQVVRLFAVDEMNRESHSRTARIDPAKIDLLLNCVDLDRFQPRAPLPERPRRALLLSKNAAHVEAVRGATRNGGLALDEIGSVFNRVVDDLHVRLKDYDIVVSSARMALEALAVGCAVVVCDGRGLAGMVTSDVVDRWRANNFGLKILTQTPTVETVSAHLERYSSSDATLVSARIRGTASLSDQLDRLEAIYRDMRSNWTCSLDDQRRNSDALAAFMADWVHRRGLPIVSGDIAVLLAQHVAKLEERDRLLASYSGLLHQLWSITLRKLGGRR